MSTKTVVLSKKEIMDLKARYPMAQERKTPPYAIYQIKLSDCVITAYESGKVVFQGDGADYHADSYAIIEKKKPQKKKAVFVSSCIPNVEVMKLVPEITLDQLLFAQAMYPKKMSHGFEN